MYVYVCICMYVCMYVCIYVCTLNYLPLPIPLYWLQYTVTLLPIALASDNSSLGHLIGEVGGGEVGQDISDSDKLSVALAGDCVLNTILLSLTLQ